MDLNESRENIVNDNAAPNNSFNPTALSLPFINVYWLRLAGMLSSGGGLIRAFGGFAVFRTFTIFMRIMIDAPVNQEYGERASYRPNSFDNTTHQPS
jgi:hypothetical protein